MDQTPDVQWVILIILDSNLTSFDAWQLDRHRDELMFQFHRRAGCESKSACKEKVKLDSIISNLQMNISHLRYGPIKEDSTSHSRVN